MNLLQVSHLHKTLRGTVVLDDINFHSSFFKRIAIAGETGSGKTSLLKVLAGLIQPDSGSVSFEGERILGPEEKLLPGHPHIAYLSQHFELRNNYRLDDYLEMTNKVDEKVAKHIYEICRIDHLLNRKTDQLSGGERQRTALARLLTTSPRLLLLDEPYSNLDGNHKQLLKAVINDIVSEGKTSCIMVSHDPVDVLPWAEQLLVMHKGKIIQQDAPERIYKHPVDEYTGGLFGDYNVLNAVQARNIFGAKGLGNEQRLFVRPENIQLVKGEHWGQQKGFIIASYFFGSYVELEVLFSDYMLIVKLLRTPLQKGDVVTASITPDDVWVL